MAAVFSLRSSRETLLGVTLRSSLDGRQSNVPSYLRALASSVGTHAIHKQPIELIFTELRVGRCFSSLGWDKYQRPSFNRPVV